MGKGDVSMKKSTTVLLKSLVVGDLQTLGEVELGFM